MKAVRSSVREIGVSSHMRCPTLSTVCGDPSAIPSCRAFHSDHSSSPRGTLGIMLYNGFFDPSRPYFIRWGNLPHLRQEGGLYFVTFRLNDSIPLKKLQVWDRALKTLRGHNTSREGADRVRLAGEIESLTSQIEVWLDRGWGSCALRLPQEISSSPLFAISMGRDMNWESSTSRQITFT